MVERSSCLWAVTTNQDVDDRTGFVSVILCLCLSLRPLPNICRIMNTNSATRLAPSMSQLKVERTPWVAQRMPCSRCFCAAELRTNRTKCELIQRPTTIISSSFNALLAVVPPNSDLSYVLKPVDSSVGGHFDVGFHLYATPTKLRRTMGVSGRTEPRWGEVQLESSDLKGLTWRTRRGEMGGNVYMVRRHLQ